MIARYIIIYSLFENGSELYNYILSVFDNGSEIYNYILSVFIMEVRYITI